jgi:parallel beta-helix repeat protein
MEQGIVSILVGILVILSTIIPVSATALSEKTSHPLIMGSILYVGGSGPNNYTKIQDAINDASDGDTVFVYDDSSPYIENIMIDKSISLIGEEKNTTIIDGNRTDDVIHIKTDGVTISGFSIINSKNSAGSDAAGIVTNVNHTTITDNIIKNNFFGIASWNNPSLGDFVPSENIIRNNLIYSNYWTGIILSRTNNSIIADNIIFNNNFTGITTHMAFGNRISGNKLLNNEYGLYVIESNKNKISENHIANNTRYGIVILDSKNNVISQNNFIGNEKRNAIFVLSIMAIGRNSWDSNYWDNHKQYFYPILGRIALQQFIEIGIIPWFQFDWHPAQEPYVIP